MPHQWELCRTQMVIGGWSALANYNCHIPPLSMPASLDYPSE
jgi:hypothetical protein